MTIGELVQRIEATKPKSASDLLNGPHKLCECGETEASCCSPLPRDPSRGKP